MLIAAVQRGEMNMDEAHKRDNLYNLARLSPCIADPYKYALDMPEEELPPVIFSGPARWEVSQKLWEECGKAVKERQMGPYEAALAYYEAMNEQ